MTLGEAVESPKSRITMLTTNSKNTGAGVGAEDRWDRKTQLNALLGGGRSVRSSCRWQLRKSEKPANLNIDGSRRSLWPTDPNDRRPKDSPRLYVYITSWNRFKDSRAFFRNR